MTNKAKDETNFYPSLKDLKLECDKQVKNDQCEAVYDDFEEYWMNCKTGDEFIYLMHDGSDEYGEYDIIYFEFFANGTPWFKVKNNSSSVTKYDLSRVFKAENVPVK